jgi:presenilin-like A22 family membrane protease
MKHTLKITLILIAVFFLSQVIGLAITNEYIDHQATAETGNVTWASLPYNFTRPEIEGGSAFTTIIAAILIGTVLVLLLIRFKKINWWKIWFLFAVIITLSFAFSAFINQWIALILAVFFGAYKIFRPNILVQNLTELFIYGGLAAIFVPILSLFWVFMLLIAISIYDMIAVWQSKHMIKLAKFQTKAKVFAGILMPYKLKRPHKKETFEKLEKSKISQIKKSYKLKKEGIKTAILGGGDIGFPLIFAGVIMKDLMLTNPELIGFLKALIIPVFVSMALLGLFIKSKKDRFYPAMPFISIGCVAGFIALKLVEILI